MDIHSPADSAGRWPASLMRDARLIEIDTALQWPLWVERFTGTEAVCAPFRFEIDCFSPVESPVELPDPAVLLGQPITLRLLRAGDGPGAPGSPGAGIADAGGGHRFWHGHCTGFARLDKAAGADLVRSSLSARYRLSVEPWTAFLRLRRNALIFQDLDALGVLARVFADYPQAAFRFDVSQSLPVPAITTQYRESDWDFATRLLADAGLAWRFEHAQHAGGKHTLVVFDREAALPEAAPATLRFHRSDATESLDAITHFSEQCQAVPNAVATASWQAGQVVAVSATAQSRSAGPHLPGSEVYAMPRAGRFSERAHADTHAALQLDALRLPRQLHGGGGSGRGLDAGAAFVLSQHPGLSGQAFVPLVVEHAAANNLAGSASVAQAADPGDRLASPLDPWNSPNAGAGLERGSYRNRFLAVPLGTAIVPSARPRPLAPGPQTARVVGLADAVSTSNRDHQVRIQFAWQRGVAPNAGGLAHDAAQGCASAAGAGSAGAPAAHAPGNESSGAWVRVAEWLAGPNWGTHTLPRIGSEVLVEFLHADIDQPVVTGQLYNGEVAPPFALGDATQSASGADAGNTGAASSNHPGTLSGLHSQSLDGSGTQQWVIDDAPGQLRQRLHTSLADSRLELGYLLDHSDSQRGGLRGQGFDLATLGWGTLRAGQGVLLSTSARNGGASTQLDVAEAVSHLKTAADTAQALSDAAQRHHVAALSANAQQTMFTAVLDVEQDGKYAGSVAGQAANKPSGGQREGAHARARGVRGASAAAPAAPGSTSGAGGATAGAAGGAPVERFAQPVLLVEGPDRIALTSPKSALAYAGGHIHLTTQADTHLAAGHTFAGIAGGFVALFAQQGPIRTIAAHGPVTLQAHSGPLELLADRSVTITAAAGRIDMLAKQKIVLQAGQTRITLEGGDITFACPGNFTVKASENPFLGGASGAAALDRLPDTQINAFDEQFRLVFPGTDDPVAFTAYRITTSSGLVFEGTTDEDGCTERVRTDSEEELDIEIFGGEGSAVIGDA